VKEEKKRGGREEEPACFAVQRTPGFGVRDNEGKGEVRQGEKVGRKRGRVLKRRKGLWSGVVTNGLRKGKSEGQVDCCGETTQH